MPAAAICALSLLLSVAMPAVARSTTAEAEATAGEVCDQRSGQYQQEVESYLGLPQDGLQSEADCEVIRAMQVENDMTQRSGYADLATYRAALFTWAKQNVNELDECPTRSGVVVCVDMTRQLLWVQDGGDIAFGPVPARSGSPSYPTRSGWYKLYKREKEFWSSLYDAPMPFSQFFDGGEAIHGSHRPIFEDPGSHGCVNLRYDDARALWSGLRIGDAVYVWGERTGD
ncbi:L,D-transpeptidase [Streptomyces sp. NPDC085639]|uniref:L,D-transpeptidase n=1 Tax=Streptomyces sp. NPDC085639 TaxID=3365734 RepID=UPI0037D0065D